MDEAARLLGLSKSTVKRALEELQEKGFIVCMRPGQWYGRLATEWAVTDKGVNGNAATRAWQQWSAPSVLIRHTKTEIGTDTAPSAPTTVPHEYRGPRHGAA
jgi:predicted ArsR family transcriptional regulator